MKRKQIAEKKNAKKCRKEKKEECKEREEGNTEVKKRSVRERKEKIEMRRS